MEPSCECKEVSKSQWVRLADVWIIGPAMVWAGLDTTKPKVLRYGLIGMGIGTVLYNARNFYLTREASGGNQ
jgi:hypothetical protein